MELFGRLIFEVERLRPFLPTYLHLLASALFPIYIGAHASLAIPCSAAPPDRRQCGADDADSADEEPEVSSEKIEGLTPKDAILFPLLAGFTLSTLYFIIKWLEDPSILNKILSYYFMQVGLFFGTKFLKDALTVVRSMCSPNQYAYGGLLWKVNKLKQRYDAAIVESGGLEAYHHASPLPGRLCRLPVPKAVSDRMWQVRHFIYAKGSLTLHIHRVVTLKVPVDLLDALALSISLAVVGLFTFVIKPWYVSNLLGFAFCYGSMQYMSPTTFWTGTLLLSALFFYDIYFVFFTPMMVTVATKLDIPIKLLFPRPPSPTETEKGSAGFAMLGLGDIVIPGMMIALALRFDLYLHYERKLKTVEGKLEKATYIPVTGGWGERFWVGRFAAGDLQAKAFPKPYFKTGLLGYALGMIVTLLVMQISEHAQPALLYLVPGVLVTLWGTAAVRGDLQAMWRYTEDKDADERNDLSKKKSKDMRSIEQEKEPKKEPKKRGSKETRQAEDSAEQAGLNDGTGDVIKSRGSAGDAELASTDEDKDGTSDTADALKTPSESTAESETTSDTEAGSHSEEGKHVGQKAAKTLEKEEQSCRHLVSFSIDFPTSRISTEQSGPRKSVSEGDDAGVGMKKSSNRTVREKATLADGEPPGKRRRVK